MTITYYYLTKYNFNTLIYKENTIILNNTQIKNVNNYKYLGITIDNRLNFKLYTINFYLNYLQYIFTYINYH